MALSRSRTSPAWWLTDGVRALARMDLSSPVSWLRNGSDSLKATSGDGCADNRPGHATACVPEPVFPHVRLLRGRAVLPAVYRYSFDNWTVAAS